MGVLADWPRPRGHLEDTLCGLGLGLGLDRVVLEHIPDFVSVLVSFPATTIF